MAILERTGRGPVGDGSANRGVGVLASLFLVLSALLVAPSPLSAANENERDSADPAPETQTVSSPHLRVEVPGVSDPDFLFKRPMASITLRGGVFRNRARGEIFDSMAAWGTAQKSDFLGGAFGAEVGIWLSESWEATISLDGTRTEVRSESLSWEELDGSAVAQTTEFQVGPSLLFGIKRYLIPRGESLGQFIWVPTRFSPFVGGGVGFSGYSFRQHGAFVDEADLDCADGNPDILACIYDDDLKSQGSSLIASLGGGAEINLTRRTAASVEFRYHWGQDSLDGDFRSFDPIDLGGLRLSAGLSVRF